MQAGKWFERFCRRSRQVSGFTIPVALTIAWSGVGADPYPVNDAVDVLHYRFELELRDDSAQIAGRATVRFRALADDVRELPLDLIGRADSGDGRGMSVDRVTAGDEALSFGHENDRLTIALPAPLPAGAVADITVEYRGEAATGLIIGDNKYGERTYFSDNWPNKARHWLPVVDHIADKATSEFVVTAPSRLQLVSNGLLKEQTDLGDGRRRTHWMQSVPISPWLYVLGAAQFAVQYVDEFDGKSIQTWVYHQDRDEGFYDFAVPTRAALEFYSSYVGPFEYEKLANIQSNSVGGGMEAASAILYGDDSVTGARTDRWQTVIVHEIAHQWFGNSVTEANWDHVWLSEGFATYFAYLFFEHAYGHERFLQKMLDARDSVYELYAETPQYRIVHDNLEDMRDVTSRLTYQKGAWILHMLRNRIGDEAWWSGIRAYYAAHRNGLATTDDFLAAMERACTCDLTAFFEQWLYAGGNIVLAGDWHYDADGRSLEIRLEQVQQDGHLFVADVEIGVYEAGTALPSVYTSSLGPQAVTLRVPMEREPERVVLDPQTVLLARWEFGRRE